MIQIVVERLTKNINENHLRELFGSFGEIVDMDMPMNRQCKLRLLSI
jgi:RNA-binding protein with serine-rich domain 1